MHKSSVAIYSARIVLYNVINYKKIVDYCRYICKIKILFVHLRTIFDMKMEKDKSYTVKQEQLARFAKALGHPARIAIMQFLAKQETCYFGDIHEELPIAKATVSQHLKELKNAGLIQGQIETPKVKYCINRDNWALAKQVFGEFFCNCQKKKGGCC